MKKKIIMVDYIKEKLDFIRGQNIYRASKFFRKNVWYIYLSQSLLSFCFDCPCGAAMWSGCDVSAIAPAKIAKKNKKIWVAISGVKYQVCWEIFVCIIENRRCFFVRMKFAKTHEVDISDVIGLLHSSSFQLVQLSEVVWFPKVFNTSGQNQSYNCFTTAL